MTNQNDKAKWTDLGLSYEAALHGVQCAIGYAIETKHSNFAEPKHMRVGVDSAHVSNGALVNLLLRKGLITRDEFEEELRLAANHELAKWEAIFGGRIKFR